MLCFGCNKPIANTTLAAGKAPYTQHAPYDKAIAPGEEPCDTSFALFIQKFENDTVFQLRHTEFPLFYTYSDEDFPLDFMEGYIDREEYDVVNFSKDSLIYHGKKYASELYTERAKDSVHYYQAGKGSYVNLRYHFAFKEGCWYLVQFDDMTD